MIDNRYSQEDQFPLPYAAKPWRGGIFEKGSKAYLKSLWKLLLWSSEAPHQPKIRLGWQSLMVELGIVWLVQLLAVAPHADGKAEVLVPSRQLTGVKTNLQPEIKMTYTWVNLWVKNTYILLSPGKMGPDIRQFKVCSWDESLGSGFLWTQPSICWDSCKFPGYLTVTAGL